MSYGTVNQAFNDTELRGRVLAACAAEGRNPPDPAFVSVIWPVVTAPDVEAAYASALEAENPSPGGDPSVITDGMILSAVQANLPPEEGATRGGKK